MSIEVFNNPKSVLLSGIDSASYVFSTKKGIGKLKAVFYMFMSVELTVGQIDNLLRFYSNLAISKKIHERLVYQCSPILEVLARKDMSVYDFIKDRFTDVGRSSELLEFKDLPSEEVMDKMKIKTLFTNEEMKWVRGENGLKNVELCKFLRDRYKMIGCETEFDSFQKLSVDELFEKLEKRRLFSSKEFVWLQRQGADLEGSPYW